MSMISLSISLSIFFFLIFIIGLVWMLSVRGKTTIQYYDNKTDPDSVFYSGGFEYKKTANYTYSEIRTFLKQGHFKKAAPPLITATGIQGFMLFLSLALFCFEVNFITICFLLMSIYFIIYGLYLFVTAE